MIRLHRRPGFAHFRLCRVGISARPPVMGIGKIIIVALAGWVNRQQQDVIE